MNFMIIIGSLGTRYREQLYLWFHPQNIKIQNWFDFLQTHTDYKCPQIMSLFRLLLRIWSNFRSQIIAICIYIPLNIDIYILYMIYI